MTETEFNNLIKKDKYQVFLFNSLCSIPTNFARHHWFVVNKKGVISRWDVLFRLLRGTEFATRWGHVYSNFLPNTTGVEIFPYFGKPYWKSKLLKVIEGDENSVARKMADFIENSKENYPHKDIYHLTGPNSNTYIQWILNNFPELNIKLGWNAFGKNYNT